MNLNEIEKLLDVVSLLDQSRCQEEIGLYRELLTSLESAGAATCLTSHFETLSGYPSALLARLAYSSRFTS
jgi:hypothetical protein